MNDNITDNEDDFKLVKSKRKVNFKYNLSKLENNEAYCKIETNYKNDKHNKTNKHDKKEIKILTQEEMMEILISKIKLFDNIEIKTKEIKDFYAINVRIDLSKISNRVFHSAKLNTVSHNNRIVNMKLVFSDNEHLHQDMKINIDVLIQCFREIAPDTITNIHIDTFKDQLENKHLSLIISTIKGSSLIYVYKRMMDFVTVINEKYGTLQSYYSNYKEKEEKDEEKEKEEKEKEEKEEKEKNNNCNIIEELIETHVVEKEKPIMEKPIMEKPIMEKPIMENPIMENPISGKPIMENPIMEKPNENKNKNELQKTIIINFENTKKEERRLILELDNIRKLLKSQEIYILKNSIINETEIKIIEQKVTIDNNINIDKNSFAYKVMNGIKT